MQIEIEQQWSLNLTRFAAPCARASREETPHECLMRLCDCRAPDEASPKPNLLGAAPQRLPMSLRLLARVENIAQLTLSPGHAVCCGLAGPRGDSSRMSRKSVKRVDRALVRAAQTLFAGEAGHVT